MPHVSPHPRPRRRTPLRLLAIVVLLVSAVLATTIAPAEAQRDQPRRDAQRTTNVRQTDVRPVDVRPEPEVEELRLHCAPDAIGDQRGVLCRWSESSHPHLRAYQLYRIVDGSARQLLTTVGRDGRLGYFDTDVSAPSNLVYGVVARNRSGRVVGLGGPVHIELGTTVEELRFACNPDFINEQRGILCRWSEPTRDVRGYLVYRSVADRPREVIARIGADGRNAHFDTDVVAGAVHTYAVAAVVGDGAVVATGGPARVQWPAAD